MAVSADRDRRPWQALARFQTLLGVLLAWKLLAGELRDETRVGLGEGPARDQAGNQWLALGPANDYRMTEGEIERFAENARRGIEGSQNLRSAARLYGRTNRNAADYYMIHEYALREFGDKDRVRGALSISANDQTKLKQSANSLSPLDGGRHAEYNGPARWNLGQQRVFSGKLLTRWFEYASGSAMRSSGEGCGNCPPARRGVLSRGLTAGTRS